MIRKALVLCLLSSGWLLAADPDSKIERRLMSVLADEADVTSPFFIVFGDRPNLKPAYAIRDREARGQFVVQALQQTAARSQNGVQGYLRGQRVAFTSYWVENKIYVPAGTLELARALARRPEVVAILPEESYRVPEVQSAPASSISGIEWNISKIKADQVWSAYTRGSGIVVANIDTGVQYTHTALSAQYRGAGGTHAGNWYDPALVCGPAGSAPCDNMGHGSHTMGTMLGYDGGTNQVGVAPEAKWIACKGCESNSCSGNSLLACAQWIMSPNGQTSLRPHVVNNSWGGGRGDAWYRSYVQSWVAAAIFPAFSNGNSGPACNTANSPGDYPESFAAGATDSNDGIASFSSRGPSGFSSSLIKPDVSAPGVSVRSSVPNNAYASYSGTSMASPHVAGTVALMWAAAGGLAGSVGTTEAYLRQSTVPLTTGETCGGIAANTSPNNTYGAGRIDALAAVVKAGGPLNQPPTVTILTPANGAPFNCGNSVAFTADADDPDGPDPDSSIVWTEGGASFGGGTSASKPYTCSQLGNHTIVASVIDNNGATDTDSITISIVDPAIPAAPSNLKATVSGSTVLLTWTDNATTEDGFVVERKKNGGSWVTLPAKIGQNITSASDTPGRGNWSYRVRATLSGHQSSDPSNVVTAKLNR